MPELPTRRLGRTGMTPCALGLGRAFLYHADEQETIRAIHRALDVGIDFFDTFLGARSTAGAWRSKVAARTSTCRPRSAPMPNRPTTRAPLPAGVSSAA